MPNFRKAVMRQLALILILAVATFAQAFGQNTVVVGNQTSGFNIHDSELPANANPGDTYFVVDLASGSDCSVGGGSVGSACTWDGSAWVPTSSAGGSGSTTTIKVNGTSITTQNPVTFDSGTGITVSNPSTNHVKFDLSGPGSGTEVQVNGVDTTAQTPISFNNGTNITASNTSAGNIQFSLTGTIPCARQPALTGDITTSAGSCGTTLPNIVTAATATKLTVNAKGQITATTSAVLASADYVNQGSTTTVLHGNAAGNPSWAGVSNSDLLGSITFSNLVGTDITAVGTLVTGTWNATTIAATKGGTGQTTYAKGDLLASPGSNALNKLGVGTDGQVLTADAASLNGMKWATGSGSSPLTTKGDLFGHDTVDNRIAVGSDGAQLRADSTVALGVKWDCAPQYVKTAGAVTSSSATLDTSLIGGAITIASGCLSNGRGIHIRYRFNHTSGGTNTTFKIKINSTTVANMSTSSVTGGVVEAIFQNDPGSHTAQQGIMLYGQTGSSAGTLAANQTFAVDTSAASFTVDGAFAVADTTTTCTLLGFWIDFD